MISSLFQNPADQAKAQEEERRRKALAAGQVGSPGKISTLLGYLGNQAGQQ